MFTLSHSSVGDCLPYMSQLHRASMLPSAEQNSMVIAPVSVSVVAVTMCISYVC